MKLLKCPTTYIFTPDYDPNQTGDPTKTLGRWITLEAGVPLEVDDDVAAMLLLEPAVQDVTPEVAPAPASPAPASTPTPEAEKE